jgi:hypothetical protein
LSAAAWPDLDLGAWAPTKKTLQLTLQMLGKLRLALAPPLPNWLFTALYLTARGVTTGAMPLQGDALQGTLDVFSSELILERSDGRTRRVPLVPARTIADIYADLLAALAALDVAVRLSPVPQEIADVTPFDEDRRTAEYDPAAVRRWFQANTAIACVFEEARSPFFGRTGIQLWWGASDLALLFFNGKHVPAPRDRGYLLRYDLDAEMLNVGFYPGDDANAPFFYGYIYPQPANPAECAVAAGATWSATLGEWVLPYATVRATTDPAATLRAFVDSLYALCGSAAGWDLAALSYDRPR